MYLLDLIVYNLIKHKFIAFFNIKTNENYQNMKKRFVPLGLLAFYALSLFAITFFAATPKVFAAPNNSLAYIADNCGNMKREDNKTDSQWLKCQYEEKELLDDIGCTDKMFYLPKDSRDETKTLDTWYVKVKEFNECYKKAIAKINKIAGPSCNDMIKGTDKWEECAKEEDRLEAAFGCSGNLFKKADGPYWTQDDDNVKKCKDKIEAAGAKGVLKPDGERSGPAKEVIEKEEAAKTNEEEQEADCDATGVILSWIICPIIDLGVNFTDLVFETFIEPMLANVPVSTEKNDGAYIAWSQFRLIANILLVGALMAIVYSQARGGGGK